ncbi:hypothetical protein FNV43_RR05743 [Rhamnella rubrinervis]|uniref:Uncharacterized protein n=1 Tax=Rhamnella rubrinervis TaxID=2594499 RepID=A0A8K0HPD1_9ROSA|nr:hypothetical protein FNV43_RR05743 [Rhamnella rubrinervis]
MAPLKRLRKASDKSTKATTVTEVAVMKKRSREVEESSNALQDTPRSDMLRHLPNWPRGVLLLYTGYSSAKFTKASAKLAEGCHLVIYEIRLNVSRHRPSWARGASCYIHETLRQMLASPRRRGASYIQDTRPNFRASTVGRGVLLLYTGYPAKCRVGKDIPRLDLADASAYLAEGSHVYNKMTPLGQLGRCLGTFGRGVSRRIIPEGAGDVAHLTVISNLQVALKVIYNKLQKRIDQFEASIFGDFTRMKTVQFCGGFVYHLLLKQLYNDDPHVIEFEFNGVGASFRSKMEARKHRTSYSLYGFPLAFQMWGFHVIPMVPNMTPLGAFFGVRYPRMLGYQFPNILHYNKLANDVFNKKQYIANNELISTEKELQKTYMINFWVRLDDKQYVGPPVVHVSPSSAALEPELKQEPVYTIRTSTQSQPKGAHLQHLEGMINESGRFCKYAS